MALDRWFRTMLEETFNAWSIYKEREELRETPTWFVHIDPKSIERQIHCMKVRYPSCPPIFRSLGEKVYS